MRQALLLIAGIFMIFSALCFAQDPDDPGAPDSLIIGSIDVGYQPGTELFVDVPIYFVTDDSIASIMLPLDWESSDGNISVVSATWNGVFENWEGVYIDEDYDWYLGWHDLGGDEIEPLLYTGGSRIIGLTLEFRIAPEAEEQFCTIGIGEGPNGLPFNFGIMTFDSDGDITPVVSPGFVRYGTVGVDEPATSLPTQFAISQNYPNPFNPETNVDYQIPEAGYVELCIFNVLGQNVRTLVAENKAAGFYTAHWNGLSNSGDVAPSGMYFYRITAGSYTDTKKMIMLK